MTMRGILAMTVAIGVTGCAAGGVVSQGGGGTAATGSAAGASAEDANVVRCDETLGTLAVDDGTEESWYWGFRRRTGVTDVEPMIRLIAQQSNCFIVTSLGNVRRTERLDDIVDRTRNSGDFREGSNFEGGQQVAADYFLEPTILFADSDAGGLGGTLGSSLGGVFDSVGGLVDLALDQTHTTVNLSLFGIREGVQLAASEGSATASDLGGLVNVFGSAGVAGLSGFTKTPEGKATVAAFLDAYNKMVVALQTYEAQQIEGGSGTGGRLQVN